MSTRSKLSKREAVVAEARSWIGVRWRHQGRSKEFGVDCVGLIQQVGRALGLTDYDWQAYDRDSSAEDIHRHLLAAGMIKKSILRLGPGDVLTIRDRIMPTHLGIYSGGYKLIHAHSSARRVVEWSYTCLRPVAGVYEYPGIDHVEST